MEEVGGLLSEQMDENSTDINLETDQMLYSVQIHNRYINWFYLKIYYKGEKSAMSCGSKLNHFYKCFI